jgi:hypothetical protein
VTGSPERSEFGRGSSLARALSGPDNPLATSDARRWTRREMILWEPTGG